MKRVKRKLRRSSAIVAAAALAAVVAQVSPCEAQWRWNQSWEDEVPPDRDHPLRIVHYFVAPVGEFLDWALIRPMARVGEVVAPYEHIDARGFRGCSRERPARSCTNVVR